MANKLQMTHGAELFHTQRWNLLILSRLVEGDATYTEVIFETGTT